MIERLRVTCFCGEWILRMIRLNGVHSPVLRSLAAASAADAGRLAHAEAVGPSGNRAPAGLQVRHLLAATWGPDGPGPAGHAGRRAGCPHTWLFDR